MACGRCDTDFCRTRRPLSHGSATLSLFRPEVLRPSEKKAGIVNILSSFMFSSTHPGSLYASHARWPIIRVCAPTPPPQARLCGLAVATTVSPRSYCSHIRTLPPAPRHHRQFQPRQRAPGPLQHRQGRWYRTSQSSESAPRRPGTSVRQANPAAPPSSSRARPPCLADLGSAAR